jgi:hypothetical protein
MVQPKGYSTNWNREFRKKNPEESKRRIKAQYEKHKEKKLQYSKEYRKNNPEKIKATNKDQYEKHGEKYLERKKEKYKSDPAIRSKRIEAYRKYRLTHLDQIESARRKKKYGLTDDDYARLVKDAGTNCPICKQSFGENKPVIDHSHKTNIVRGIICHKCNLALGLFNDNINILLNAINYLNNKKI